MTGGCQCGRVRYSVALASSDAYLCHCRMCQRASGNVAIAFLQVIKADLHWEGEPDWYASSLIARRPFCSTCGTTLGFEYPDGAKIDLTVGSLDDASGLKPTAHFGTEHLNEAWLDTRALPRQRADEYPPLQARWGKSHGS